MIDKIYLNWHIYKYIEEAKHRPRLWTLTRYLYTWELWINHINGWSDSTKSRSGLIEVITHAETDIKSLNQKITELIYGVLNLINM